MKKNSQKRAQLISGLAIITAACIGLASAFVYLSIATSVDAAPLTVRVPLLISPISVTTVLKPSEIVIAGLGSDTAMGAVKWKNAGTTPVQVKKIYLSVTGGESYSADFAQVGIRKPNGSVAYGIPDSAGNLTIDLGSTPITIGANTSSQSDLVARFNSVVSDSIAGGNWTGIARSGHQPVITMTAFDRVNTSNAIVKQSVSGIKTNPMVLRKSKPVISAIPLSSATLANIDLDLMKFQMTAPSAGPIAWKQMMFSYKKSSGLQLSNFRLRRGTVDVLITNYSVVDGFGANLQTGTLSDSSQTGYVIVALQPGQEQVISGSGDVYTLHATVMGVTSGKTLEIALYNAPAQVITAHLSNRGYSAPLTSPNAKIYHLASTTTQMGILAATGDFLWSDLSEVPHAVGNTNQSSSKDWTNGTYVQSLKQVSKLSL